MQNYLRVAMVALLIGICPSLSYSYYEEKYLSYNDSDSYQEPSSSYSYETANDDNYARFHYTSNSNYPERSYQVERHYRKKHHSSAKKSDSRLAGKISAPGEKVIIVDPRVHRWGAYDAQGNLLRSGMTSAGSGWCRDLGRSCHTSVGTFRIWSLGSSGCKSRKFPIGRGGAPMPYCMYFNRNQALHGSYEVANANISHGCVRLHVDDAAWLRFNFARIGTKVIIKPYY